MIGNVIYRDKQTGLELLYEATSESAVFYTVPAEHTLKPELPSATILVKQVDGDLTLQSQRRLGLTSCKYDLGGTLTYFGHQPYMPGANLPSLSFGNFIEDQWEVYRTVYRTGKRDNSMPNPRQFVAVISLGEEILIDGAFYLLDIRDGRLVIGIRNDTDGDRSLEIARRINIDHFKRLIGSDRWPEVLRKYPVNVEVVSSPQAK